MHDNIPSTLERGAPTRSEMSIGQLPHKIFDQMDYLSNIGSQPKMNAQNKPQWMIAW
tara:strand:- start:12 stop:182 length:171 start_codon:yes stop_codon:yes gene_type:complete